MDNISTSDSNGSNIFANSTGDGDLTNSTVFQVMGGLSIAIMIIGIPGNFLVIASISLNKHMRTAANFLVLNLSVFDFLFLCTMLPVHTYTYITARAPPTKYCWAVGFITNWLVASSVMSTGSIAINRYIAIVVKSKYHYIDGKKPVIVTCAIVLLFPFLLLAPSFEGSMGSFGYQVGERSCSWERNATLRGILIGSVLIFPLVFMTLCYIRIVLFVITSKNRVGVHTQVSVPQGNSSQKKETRLSLMLAMVYVVYLVTSLPSLVMNFVVQAGIPVPLAALRIAFVAVWISTAANPVMYGLVNKKYRNAYKNLAGRISGLTRRWEVETTVTNVR